jgi:hypothetical protein
MFQGLSGNADLIPGTNVMILEIFLDEKIGDFLLRKQ